MDCRQVDFSGHAVPRMFERSITLDEALAAIAAGEVIEEYPEDVPFPSVLLLARIQKRVLHAVVAKDRESGSCYLITVYPPDPALWEPDFRTRRPS
ncbi:MAG: hypothetical protein QOH06_2000 [Acidobacteriota bacterium]|nr:hypothetical protein [Acidobacteriota bacterium]